MFVGHFAAALGAKRAAPRVPLSLLVAAAIGLDLIWPILLLTGADRPDLPLWPGGPKYGLGLWHSIPATFIVEGLMLGAAVYAYRTAFPPRDRTGHWAFVALIAFMTVIWASSPFSPPPPGVQAIAVAGFAMWLFPIWAGWVEKHRRSPVQR